MVKTCKKHWFPVTLQWSQPGGSGGVWRCTWAPMTGRLGVEVAGAHVVRPQQWLWKWLVMSRWDQDQCGSIWINVAIHHHVTNIRHYANTSKFLLVLERLRSSIRTFSYLRALSLEHVQTQEASAGCEARLIPWLKFGTAASIVKHSMVHYGMLQNR